MIQLNNVVFSDDIELINIRDTDDQLCSTEYIIKLDGIKLEVVVGNSNNIDDEDDDRLYWLDIRSQQNDIRLTATQIYHKGNQTRSKPDGVKIRYSGFSIVSGNLYQLYLNSSKLSLQLCLKSTYTQLDITVRDCDRIHTIKIYDNDGDLIQEIL